LGKLEGSEKGDSLSRECGKKTFAERGGDREPGNAGVSTLPWEGGGVQELQGGPGVFLKTKVALNHEFSHQKGKGWCH